MSAATIGWVERQLTGEGRIDGVELVFGVKAGSNNKLYGSITSQMIKDALLEKTGLARWQPYSMGRGPGA